MAPRPADMSGSIYPSSAQPLTSLLVSPIWKIFKGSPWNIFRLGGKYGVPYGLLYSLAIYIYIISYYICQIAKLKRCKIDHISLKLKCYLLETIVTQPWNIISISIIRYSPVLVPLSMHFSCFPSTQMANADPRPKSMWMLIGFPMLFQSISTK